MSALRRMWLTDDGRIAAELSREGEAAEVEFEIDHGGGIPVATPVPDIFQIWDCTAKEIRQVVAAVLAFEAATGPKR